MTELCTFALGIELYLACLAYLACNMGLDMDMDMDMDMDVDVDVGKCMDVCWMLPHALPRVPLLGSALALRPLHVCSFAVSWPPHHSPLPYTSCRSTFLRNLPPAPHTETKSSRESCRARRRGWSSRCPLLLSLLQFAFSATVSVLCSCAMDLMR